MGKNLKDAKDLTLSGRIRTFLTGIFFGSPAVIALFSWHAGLIERIGCILVSGAVAFFCFYLAFRRK